MLRNRVLLLAAAVSAFSQTAPVLEGDWHGTVSAGGASLRLALHIEKAPDGLYLGRLDSLDQGSVLPIDSLQRAGDRVTFTIKAVNGSFQGTLAADKLTG